MVRMGTVWDRTVEVIGGRIGILASVALLTIFLPTVLADAVTAFAPSGTATRAVSGLVSLAQVVVMFWGILTLTAIASDPAVDGARGYAIARVRLLPAIGVLLLVGIAISLLIVPLFVLLAGSGYDFAAAQRGVTQPEMSSGMTGLIGVYGLVFLVVMIAVGARLSLLYPVLANERRGVGSVRRSFELTRGLTWRIIGVLILFGIVVLVVLAASTSVIGVIFRLILGADSSATVTFVAGVVAAAVTTAATVVQSVFAAQLYVAVQAALEGVADRA